MSSPQERAAAERDVIVHVQGHVIDITNAHGLAYKVQLPADPREWYAEGRQVWVEPTEIIEIEHERDTLDQLADLGIGFGVSPTVEERPLNAKQLALYREGLAGIPSPDVVEPLSALEAERRMWAERCRRLIATFDAEHAEEHGLVIGEGELDAAWKEAEAALPDGWAIDNLRHTAMLDQRWQVEAGSRVGPVVRWNKVRTVIAEGPTPVAALLSLAERLRR